MNCYTLTPSGLRLSLYIKPRASRNAIGAIRELAKGNALEIQVRAMPTEGQANLAVIALLSELFKVPKSKITLYSGAKNRAKVFFIEGNASALEDKLKTMLKFNL